MPKQTVLTHVPEPLICRLDRLKELIEARRVSVWENRRPSGLSIANLDQQIQSTFSELRSDRDFSGLQAAGHGFVEDVRKLEQLWQACVQYEALHQYTQDTQRWAGD